MLEVTYDILMLSSVGMLRCFYLMILHGHSGIDEARFSNYFYLCMVFMRILFNKNLIASFSGA